MLPALRFIYILEKGRVRVNDQHILSFNEKFILEDISIMYL